MTDCTEAVEQALTELRTRVDDAIPPCYLYDRNHQTWERDGIKPLTCLDLIGGTFGARAIWTLAMCCDPCRISHALHEGT